MNTRDNNAHHMKKWRHQIEEFRQLGPKRLAFRVWFEVANRSGLRERLEPTGVAGRELPAAPDMATWWNALGARHWFHQIRENIESGAAKAHLEVWLGEEGRTALLARAERARVGKIRCFSRWEADYAAGNGGIDWHLNPRTGARWPLEHASKVLRHARRCGDVKFTWEIGRFPHVYDWVRAYALTGDAKWVRAFCEQLASWEAANPYRLGVHWSSGQELAIRLMAWCFAVAAMGGDDAFTQEDFARFARLAYLHAEHIDANIAYARLAVHNNHLIGEALGLCLVGQLFPAFDRGGKWVTKGRKLLTKDCLAQFWADGGYCQSSHTYHRLALHYYLWAFQLEALSGVANVGEVRAILQRSANYLEQFLNEPDGRLPNWGANDGALLNPWTGCDYTDFRPILTALRYRDCGARSFDKGPWDEEAFWFFGAGALNAPVVPIERQTTSFEVSGLHVLRQSSDTFAVFRCGTVIDRFGQADQLHVDLWRDGKNIAIDGGSYCYNDELAFHRWFMGSASHNTVTVDGLDQMYLFRRFKWLYWTEAESDGVKDNCVVGLHRGYEHLGVRHRREVSTTTCGWRVMDSLERTDTELRTFRLHWLINGSVVAKSFDAATSVYSVSFDSDSARYVLKVEAQDAESGGSLMREDACQVLCERPAPEVAGWHSRYYGTRFAATSVECAVESAEPVRFVSRIEFG